MERRPATPIRLFQFVKTPNISKLPRSLCVCVPDTFHAKKEQFGASSMLADESSDERAVEADADDSAQPEQLMSTPTTSRTKRSRLNFASDSYINPMKSLKKLPADWSAARMNATASSSTARRHTSASHSEGERSGCAMARSSRSLCEDRIDNDADEEVDEADEEVEQINGYVQLAGSA